MEELARRRVRRCRDLRLGGLRLHPWRCHLLLRLWRFGEERPHPWRHHLVLRPWCCGEERLHLWRYVAPPS